MNSDAKRKAFAKKGHRRSRSNVEKFSSPRHNSQAHTRGNSIARCKSILKKRGTQRSKMDSDRKVHFKPKKRIIFFKTASSVVRFKKNLLKQAKLKKQIKEQSEKKHSKG